MESYWEQTIGKLTIKVPYVESAKDEYTHETITTTKKGR